MEALAVLQTSYVDRPTYDLNGFDENLVRDLKEIIPNPNPNDPTDAPPPGGLSFQTLIMWGESGTGKTTLALNLLPKALIVSHMDDLRNLSPKHYGIIFDDMSFTHIPREAQIHLLDWDLARSIHIRYGCAHIPKHTPKIFTTNVPYGLIFLDDPAINRRTKIIMINKAFI